MPPEKISLSVKSDAPVGAPAAGADAPPVSGAIAGGAAVETAPVAPGPASPAPSTTVDPATPPVDGEVAGSAGPKPKVLMEFPRLLNLTIDRTGRKIIFPAGKNMVDEEYADHWYLKANGVTRAKTDAS